MAPRELLAGRDTTTAAVACEACTANHRLMAMTVVGWLKGVLLGLG